MNIREINVSLDFKEYRANIIFKKNMLHGKTYIEVAVTKNDYSNCDYDIRKIDSGSDISIMSAIIAVSSASIEINSLGGSANFIIDFIISERNEYKKIIQRQISK